MTGSKTRTEHDSLGDVQVPSEHLWGAQTQRSLNNFPIGLELGDRMPGEIIRAFAVLKKAAARANEHFGKLDKETADRLCLVCDEIYEGKWDDEFPLSVWQTGSGTHSNMNFNEVAARLCNLQPGGKTVHPNDTVNLSQSSNDTFPTAMHIACVLIVHRSLLPALDGILATLQRLEEENRDVIKLGRTHTQDATPILFSQEISAWRSMLETCKTQILTSLSGLYRLALGGTAVGTGLNAPGGFDTLTAQLISEETGLPFVTDPNKFHALSARDDIAFAHSALRSLAADLMKIACDVRLLSSGPRCGLGEIRLPENEPGSSIMPGKVNPTQCEQVTMVACAVMGYDTIIGTAASQGQFQLNVMLPVIAFHFLRSVRLLSDSITCFDRLCLAGLKANREVMKKNVSSSLMLVTALTPKIGYEKAAMAARKAHTENLTLKEAVLALGLMDEKTFDRLTDPQKMVTAQPSASLA